MKLIQHRSVQATAAAGVVIAAGLFLLGATPATIALTALWAVGAALALTQAARA